MVVVEFRTFRIGHAVYVFEIQRHGARTGKLLAVRGVVEVVEDGSHTLGEDGGGVASGKEAFRAGVREVLDDEAELWKFEGLCLFVDVVLYRKIR